MEKMKINQLDGGTLEERIEMAKKLFGLRPDQTFQDLKYDKNGELIVETEEKLKIKYPVIVEGKYDRLRLLSVMEGQILTTEGFGIFKSAEKLALFRALAQKTPVIVLTDPDGAGKLIRAHIGSAIPPERLIPLYVPQIEGKEKRKEAPSAAGFLGVEGQERELLRRLLAPFAEDGTPHVENPLSKVDFYEDGLTGCDGAAERRDALARVFGLPSGMTPNALLAALRVIATYAEYQKAVKEL